jgi:hypothetical protein
MSLAYDPANLCSVRTGWGQGALLVGERVMKPRSLPSRSLGKGSGGRNSNVALASADVPADRVAKDASLLGFLLLLFVAICKESASVVQHT